MAGQSQEMENDDKLAESRRCFSFSRRHSLFLFLTLGVLFFFYSTNIRVMTSDWIPKQWIQNHPTKSSFPFRKQTTLLRNTNVSKARLAAAASPGPTIKATRGKSPQSTAILPTHRSVTQLQRRLSSLGTKKMLTTQTLHRTAIPYVSPGPYLVEYPYEYRYIINEPQRCEQEKPFVVLIVQVAPRNRAHRDVIRNTWGSEKLVNGKAVRLFFLLGMQTGDDTQQVHQQLQQESKDHHDLIQSNFVDCYKNLTIKTMVMLEWLNSFCSSTPYAMKIDSDMFLNVANLVNMLLQAPTTNYMTGLVAHGGQVLRDLNSKWYVPVDLFSESVYPPYALGLGYVLSIDLTKKLIEASRHVKALYIEDVYLGLCMRHLGIHPTDPPNGFYFHVFPLGYNRCSYSKIIATTTQQDTDRVWLWKDFKKNGQYC
ncbi:beta-1,3-galactosyltransferase 1-like isoform X1 [Cyprinodon tularosa]|uniref:beta-1,3-galactosyltransferase 1-like isoform X1 n=2 Tax=Cyprinodon tularosa TaxID=77115 RepID=UPI0018E22B1F|nr:beta-1,3-galactosyltransferase 1-like isoform X1 [Cyprinodon tularosa]XP_038162370.1 beta-1,3-galactosyltransferase 1-like isoform X1 [Cyprinodon tularosa]